ncbi:MAG: hypothetical protein RIR26_208 [Pseudomonadota bacterium]|jgi:hypothetical protein
MKFGMSQLPLDKKPTSISSEPIASIKAPSAFQGYGLRVEGRVVYVRTEL